MEFITTTFMFVFFPLFLLIYYLVRGRGRDAVLVAGSLILYAWGAFSFVPVLIFLAAVDFFICRVMARAGIGHRAKTVVYSIGMAANLLAFAALYLPSGSGGLCFGSVSLGRPLGLAFYVLSGISYLTDVFKEVAKPSENVLDFMVYLTMFPKLIAGPIVPYHQFFRRRREQTIRSDTIVGGMELMIRGFAKKVLLADNIGLMSSSILAMNLDSMPVATAWLGALAGLFQIYFDFSGYIDMARGIGKMLGFDLPVNLRAPFSARSITGFFTRWNITFVRWLKMYIGRLLSLRGKWSDLIKLLLMGGGYAVFLGGRSNDWLAVGYFLVFLIVEALFYDSIEKYISSGWRCLITFLLVVFGFALYLQPSAWHGIRYVADMFGAGGILFDSTSLYYASTYGILLMICLLCGNSVLRHYLHRVRFRHKRAYAIVRPIFFILLFLLTLCYNVTNPSGVFLCAAI